jgi:nucleoside-diphosphate-sugar epimerase
MLVEPKNHLINVGSEHSLSVRELADLIAKYSGVGVQILGKRSEIGNFKRLKYIPNTTKARILYPGLEEWTHIQTIVQKMLAVK